MCFERLTTECHGRPRYKSNFWNLPGKAGGSPIGILGMVQFPGPLHASIVTANGVLYISTGTHLNAIKE